MSLKGQRSREWLAKRRRNPKKAYPLATVATYGPTNTAATKLVASVFLGEEQEPEAMERWALSLGSLHADEEMTIELVEWLKLHGVQQIVMPDAMLGCPHEEGIDYPVGEACPKCPFWANRNRFTGELLDKASVGEAVEAGAEEVELFYSPHCQDYFHQGVKLEVRIYRVTGEAWSLEVINERGTSSVWDERFENDDDAYAELLRTVQEDGLDAFADSPPEGTET